MPQPKSFETGLVMAGAISAGAYTAGVVDFLLQALDEWEKEKENQRNLHNDNYGQWTIPPHDTVISVLSGASAGGIVAGILATALRAPITPVEAPPTDRTALTGNILYDSWVQKIDIKYLLETNDLNSPDDELSPVVSLLDSTILDTIRDEAMDITAQPVARPYIADPMQVFLTVSNLRGIPYRIPVKNEYVPGHDMWMHGDHVHFYYGAANGSLNGEQALHLDPTKDGAADAWQVLGQTTLATAAFPVGLAPRHLTRETNHFNKRKWAVPLDTSKQTSGPCVCWQYEPVETLLDENTKYQFLHVDGGAANNEPFELARKALKGHQDRNPRNEEDAKRAVLMVDPFPDSADMAAYEPVKNDLISSIKALFGTLKNQARFKEDELVLALDETVFSRFLIAPLRHKPSGEREKFAIASGSLGGFGGFLAHGFREHDFFLGRRNCQRFLERHFALAQNNPLFDDWSDSLKQTYRIEQNNNRLPIIPLVGRARSPVPALPWPTYTQDMFDELCDDIETRLDTVVKRLINTNTDGWFTGTIIKLVWTFKRSSIIDKVMGVIKEELTKRGNKTPKNDDDDDDLWDH